MKTGRPQTERNKQMIAEHRNNMSIDELAKKYNLGRQYVQKLVSEYKRKDRMKPDEMFTSNTTGLYVERDNAIMLFVASLAKNLRKVSPCPDTIRTNKGYNRMCYEPTP